MRFFKQIYVAFFLIVVFLALFTSSAKTQTDNEGAVSSARERHMQMKHKDWEYIQQQIEQNPDNIELLLRGAQEAVLMVDRAKAIEYLRTAVRLMGDDPNYSADRQKDALNQLIYLYLREQKFNMAVVSYKQMCDLDPNNTKLRFEFAQFLEKRDYPGRAALEYKRILDIDPDNLLVVDKLMRLYARGYISKDEIESYLPQQDTPAVQEQVQ